MAARRQSTGSSALAFARRRTQYAQQMQELKDQMSRQRRELERAKRDMFGAGGKKHVLASRGASRLQTESRFGASRSMARSKARASRAASPAGGPRFEQVRLRKAPRAPEGEPDAAGRNSPLLAIAEREGVRSADDFSALYTVLRRIGSGSFGTVSLVRSRDEHRLYALKSLPYTADDSVHERALHEVALLKGFAHPNIVEFKDAFLSASGRNLSIVMSYCESGDLHSNLRQLARRGEAVSEAQALRWLVQLCLALHYIHGRKILHRDIKPKNIFLSASKSLVKLGDFGLSRVLESTNANAHTEVGTPCYTSPEICRNQPYSRPSDVWALGCVLYEMLALEVPFRGDTIVELGMNVLRSDPPPLSADYSPEIRSLVADMLSKDPAQRPSVLQLLAHPLLRRQMHAFVETFPSNMLVAADMRRRRQELAGLRRQVQAIESSAASQGGAADSPDSPDEGGAAEVAEEEVAEEAGEEAGEEEKDAQEVEEEEDIVADELLQASLDVHRLEESVQEDSDILQVSQEMADILEGSPRRRAQSLPGAEVAL